MDKYKLKLTYKKHTVQEKKIKDYIGKSIIVQTPSRNTYY
jgi:hypothetical protein